jgi:hypothetical protein
MQDAIFSNKLESARTLGAYQQKNTVIFVQLVYWPGFKIVKCAN